MSLLKPISLLLMALAGTAAMDDSGMPPGGPSMADAMKDPAVLKQAMEMMQNPLVMQQMKTMMADPAVKARMRRMLEKLGADNPGLEGASKLATDDDALDSIFEKMFAVALLGAAATDLCSGM